MFKKYSQLISKQATSQKEWEEDYGVLWDEEEYGVFPEHSSKIVKELAPEIIRAAQQEYDAWDEENVDWYAGGGICHFIAEKIADVLISKGVNAFTQSSSHEQHVSVIAQFTDGVFNIDIPYSIYETGGGFSWKKIQDVEFTEEDISLYKISSDPRDIKEQEDW